jgi:hypothetical protein
MKAGFQDFVVAFTARWFIAMSGGLSVPAAIAAYFVPNQIATACLSITAIVCFVAASFGVWRIERQARMADLLRLATYQDDARRIEVIFDESDHRCVRDQLDLNGNISVRRWHVGVRNISSANSIDDVTLRAQESAFVTCTIGIAHMPIGRPQLRNPIILKVDTLPPGAEEFVELFGLNGTNVYGEGDILSKKQTFTLEARGRDTPTRLLVLEYDPSTRPPSIRRVS